MGTHPIFESDFDCLTEWGFVIRYTYKALMIFNLKRCICLVLLVLCSSSVFISCNFEAALKLFLVHIDFGSYWTTPIRALKCADQNVLVPTEYSVIQDAYTLNASFPSDLPLCPAVSPYLSSPAPTMSEFVSDVNRPVGCRARQRVAVIVPYRARPEHLSRLTAHLNPILARQQLQFQIFIVEQQGNGTFSRARLMNAGVKFLEMTPGQWDCYIFHDVDLLLEDVHGLYKCLDSHPRHLSSSIDKYHYRLPWSGITGGVMAFTPEQFRTVNGFSNEYWGWGCEDDDMFVRILHSCLYFEQADSQFYKFKMIIHEYEKSYKHDSELDENFRFTMATTAHLRQEQDGMSNLDVIINSTSSASSMSLISAWVGSPPPELVPHLRESYSFSVPSQCLSPSPLLTLFTAHALVIVTVLALYRYFHRASSDEPKPAGYQKLDDMSLHSL